MNSFKVGIEVFATDCPAVSVEVNTQQVFNSALLVPGNAINLLYPERFKPQDLINDLFVIQPLAHEEDLPDEDM